MHLFGLSGDSPFDSFISLSPSPLLSFSACWSGFINNFTFAKRRAQGGSYEAAAPSDFLGSCYNDVLADR